MFKYGQLIVTDADTVVEKAITGKSDVIPKGTKIVIGFDKLAHHIKTGMIQPVGDEIEGYSNTGIVEIIYAYLRSRLPLSEMLSDYDLSGEDVKEIITEALDEIGLYDE